MLRRFSPVLLSLALLLPACRADEDRLVVYSGRSQALVETFVENYRDIADRDVRVRFGRDAELLAALEEEGRRSPADLFWANTAGALSAATNAGLLVPLPDSLLAWPAAFVPSGGHWIPLSVRFRALAYDPERLAADRLPATVMELPQMEGLQGRIGWTPTYSSFQDFITAMRLVHGEAEARSWLETMQALSPRAYASNAPMLEALAAGEIDVALTNHYYVLRIREGERDERSRIAIHQFAAGDVGNLALVTGAGLLATSENHAEAIGLLAYLLSSEAQSRLAQQVFEYPVVEGAALPPGSPSFEEVLRLSPALAYEQLRDMTGTQRLLRDVGLL
jgi:iron(III) transport system substrate-binding protein